jgi:hypothetical protein
VRISKSEGHMNQENSAPEHFANVNQEMLEVYKEIERKIQQAEGPVTGFKHSLITDNFVESSIYYSEYKSKSEDEGDCFYYALHDGNTKEVILYDDGITAIKRLKEKLDSRRTFFQRIKEFSLNELIVFGIAFSTMGAFLLMCVFKTPPQELTGIAGIIVGYYFAKAKS